MRNILVVLGVISVLLLLFFFVLFCFSIFVIYYLNTILSIYFCLILGCANDRKTQIANDNLMKF